MNKKIFNLFTYMALFSIPLQVNAKNLELESSLQTVLENNPEVRKNLASIMYAEGNAIQAGVSPNPQATLGIDNFGGEGDLSGTDGAELTFGLEQELEIAGKKKYRKEVANYALEAAKQKAISNILATFANTHQSYAEYLVAKKRLNLAEKRLALAEKTYETVRKRVKAAAASDIQYTKVSIEKKSALVEKSRAIEGLEIAKAQLESILASDIPKIDKESNFLLSYFEVPDKDKLMIAIEDIPQNKVMKLKELEAKSGIELAQSYKVPNPTVGFGVRHFNETDSNAFMATLSIPITLFDRNQGNIAKAQAQHVQAESESKSNLLTLREMAKKVYQQLETASQEIKSYKDDIIPSARKAYSLASKGYNTGRFSFLELLDAQRTLYEMQESELNSLLKYHQAKSQVDFLMNEHLELLQQKISIKKGN
jgi:cobalt-zinc-cadmium efflux system outer membrane protein